MTAPTQLSFGRDVQGFNAYAYPFSTTNFSAIILANTDTTITVPPTYERWIAVITGVEPFEVWAALNQIAVIPTTNTFTSTGSMLLSSVMNKLTVNANDIIHLITDVETNVGVSFYAISY